MTYVWKGLAQPDHPSPAGMFCEPGRHSYVVEWKIKWKTVSEVVRVCRRCGARNWMPGYPKTLTTRTSHD